MNLSIEQRRNFVEANGLLSVSAQCRLLDIYRSGVYYQHATETAMNLKLMKLIDKLYLKRPFFGSRRITHYLNNFGYEVNRKRVQRLMRLMAIEGISPKRNTSRASAEHKKYPYLLSGLEITMPDQVWATDITYLPLRRGFIYLVAIMDWFSRYILSWELSNSLETNFCLEALQKALRNSKPEIFNSDQGCQFTSCEFTGQLQKSGTKISMDGRGRVFDNIFIERFWRSLKYEEVYLKNYENGTEAFRGICDYMDFYNNERPHQSLGNKTPYQVYECSTTKPEIAMSEFSLN
jgi:putative transposase